jgi:hypothetical protein
MSDHATVERLAWTGWTGFSWSEARGPGELNFDRGFLFDRGDRLRIGTLDAAVEPHHDTDTVLAALHDTMACFTPPGELATAAGWANQWPCDPDVHPHHLNPVICAAVVDLDLSDGGLEAVCAGDCQVGVDTGGQRSSLLASDMLSKPGRASYTTARARNEANATPHPAWDAQQETLDDKDVWDRAPLGLFFANRTAVVSVAEVKAVVVSADGARLSAGVLDDLETWLEGGVHQDGHGPFPHGDITVTRLART